jgi:hypothetical protein
MASDRAANFLRRLEQRRSSLREEIEDDIAPLRGLSLDERGKILESVCRDAMAILRARPDFERAMAHQDPRSPESLSTWLQLVKRYRAHGRH